jgi:hypothetical protein
MQTKYWHVVLKKIRSSSSYSAGSVNYIVLAKHTAIAGRGQMMPSNNLVDLKDDVFVIVSIKCSSNVFLVLLGRCLSRNHDFGVFFFLLGSLSLILDFFLSFHQLEACER